MLITLARYEGHSRAQPCLPLQPCCSTQITESFFPIPSDTPGHFSLPGVSFQLTSPGQFLFVPKNKFIHHICTFPVGWTKCTSSGYLPVSVNFIAHKWISWVNPASLKLYTSLFHYSMYSWRQNFVIFFHLVPNRVYT